MEILEEIESTNSYLLDLGVAGCPNGRTAIAEHQTRGKGRMGRTWYAPSGRNISMSVAFRTNRSLGGWVTLAGSCAANFALREAGIPVALKWPNDIIAAPVAADTTGVQELKLGGVLCETKLETTTQTRYVLGIGLNINLSQDDFPEELRNTATSALLLAGREFDRNMLIAGVLQGLDRYWESLVTGHTEGLLADARRVCATLGHLIRVQAGGQVIEGLAEDLDEMGRLVLRLESGVRRYLDLGEIEQTRRID